MVVSTDVEPAFSFKLCSSIVASRLELVTIEEFLTVYPKFI